MKPNMSLERRSAILKLANKRADTIALLMDNNHVSDYFDVIALVDRPVGTPEETRNATEEQYVNAVSEWYDLIRTAHEELQSLNLTLTDSASVYWYDDQAKDIMWEYANELLTNPNAECQYKGQRLHCNAVDYYAIEVCPKLQEALLDEDSAEANRLMGIIAKAVEDYI